MNYLLDTCTVSYFVRGDIHVLERIKKTSPKDLYISSITSMEIEFGLVLNPDRANKIKKVLDAFLEIIHVIPFTVKDANCAAAIRASLQKKGQVIGAYDVLLAGTAVHHGLTFITTNTREFQKISGLLIEDWRVGNDSN